MSDKFYDDVWKRQGISLIWDPLALSSICQSDQVVSLRQFFRLDANGWPDDQLDLLMVNSGRTLVVAGLEVALDALDPEAITDWIEQTLYPTMRRFQQDVADGGRGAALIFWIVEPRRFVASSTDPDYRWITKKSGVEIDISRAMFNGASKDLCTVFQNMTATQAIGLYHPRIS